MKKAVLWITIICLVFGCLSLSVFAVQRVAGDADGNGEVNLRDVVLTLRHLAGGWDVTLQTAEDGRIRSSDT